MAALAVGTVALSALLTPPPVYAQETDPPNEGVPAGEDTSPTEVDTEIEEAVDEAAETGENVEIQSLATPESEVFAAPDGTFVEEIALESYQAQTDDGLWAPIDNTLVAGDDGRLEPLNSDLGLELSPGGDTELITITDVHGRSVSYTWGSALPAPTVDGDTATYAEVIPGVDLRIRATNTGFAKVFEVKDATAAASAEVASIELGLELDGFTAAIGATGALEVSDYEGNVVYGGPTPTMWDSAAPDEEAGDAPSTDWSPSTYSMSAQVGAAYSGGELTLTPDAAMLADPNAVYPIRIDPEVVKIDSSAWAMVSNYSSYRNRSYYNGGSFEKDPNGTARLGRAHKADGSMEQTWRLAFEFSTSKFRGKDIIDANLRMTMTYSWVRSCDGLDVTADLYELDAGNLKNWTWNDQGNWGTKIASRDEGVASGCGAPRQLWTDVTDYVQDVADTSDRKIQFGLQASSESCPSFNNCPGFRRFGPEKVGDGNTGFYLSVKYNTPPNKPGSFTIDGQSCTSGKTVKLGAGTSWTVTAKLTDDDGDNMDGVLTWKNLDTSAVESRNSSGADNARATWTLKATDVPGQRYSFSVAAEDSRATGASAGGCTVLIDTTPPAAPTVVSTDYPSDGDIHGAVGMTGRFTVDSTSTDTAGYSWSLQDAYGDNTAPVSTPGAAATIALDPTSSGPQNLSVWAYDGHGNVSTKTTYTFSVNPNGSPVGHWKLDETTGTTAADTNYPDFPSDVTRPLTLTGGEWTGGTSADAADDHLRYLTLDGDDQAVSSAPVVATNASYTVSAWVRIHQTDVDYTIASQDGIVNSAFMLKYDGESHTFLIVASNQDANSSGLLAVSAGSNITAEAGVWYHVTGVFSYGSQELQLYVDGQLQNTAPFSDEWNATGAFAVGRDLWQGKRSTYYAGDVDDVKVWNRAVPAGEIQRLGQHAEGIWDFETVDPASIPDLSGAGNELSAEGPVELVEGFEGMGLKFNGVDATAVTDAAVLDTSQDFTIGVWVRLDRDGGTVNVLSQDGVNTGAFYLGHMSSGEWGFRALSADAVTGGTWKELYSDTPAQVGQWTHLAVTYEASTGTASLYVNGEPDSSGTGFALWASDGPLRVGSVLHRGTVADHWPGAIDSVNVNSGVFDDQQIKALADGTVREVHSQLVTGDFNGDTFDDALVVVESPDGEGGVYSQIYLMRNDGTGNLIRSEEPVFESDALNLDETLPWRAADVVWRTGDVTGDGRDDLVVAVPSDDHFEVWAMPACGKRDRTCIKSGAPFVYDVEKLELPAADWALADTQIQLEDLSGDQADDLVLLRGDGNSSYSIWRAKYDMSEQSFDTPILAGSGTGNSRLVELAVGDFDNDWWGDVAEIRTGADGSADVYVRYGSATGLGTAEYKLDTPNNWDTERDRVTVADVNGDGRPDLLATYRFNNRVRVNVSLALSTQRGFATPAAWEYSDRCTGCATDLTPWALTDLAGGDLDGDGREDLLTLRGGTDGDLGALWTRHSAGSGFYEAEPTWADADTCFGVEDDVNGDGYADGVMPYSSYDAEGLADSGAFWFFDGATGSVSIVTEETHGAVGTTEAGDLFGRSVALYDADGDGCSEIVVGVPGEGSSAGSVIVLPGRPGGIDDAAAYWFSQASPGVPGASEAGDRFGFSLAAANRPDGTPVLIVGMPGEDVQNDTTGAYRDGDTQIAEVVDAGALVYFQGDSNAWVDTNTYGSSTAVEAGDNFGYSISATPMKFVVGSPFEDGTGSLTDAGGISMFTHSRSPEGWPSLVGWYDQSNSVFGGNAAEAGDRTGFSVSAVDYWPATLGVDAVRTAVAISSPGEDTGGVTDAGLVNLMYFGTDNVGTSMRGYLQGDALGDTAEASDLLGNAVALYNLDQSVQATNSTLRLAIASAGEDRSSQTDQGIVHVTGAAVPTDDIDTMITDPTPTAGGMFGAALGGSTSAIYLASASATPLSCMTWVSIPSNSQQTVVATAV
ncbi:LamG-like jellyroll fold domain-containing protein [Glycomyces sp. MUSA5-2]|uniref:LamG-like jellyroll fold domain-containing protein n=1 Tax=Glycomyces sp. MUSA5-2 TaxID=2053002 RepID=UPI00300A4BF6